MRKTFLALTVLSLTFTACKKDKDEPANITPTVQNLAGSYKVEKITAKSGSNEEIPITDQWLESCEKDDISKLNADLTYQYQDAGTACDPAGDDSGTWELTNATSIVINDYPYTIRKFNGKNLEVTEDYGGATMITYLVKQ